MSDIIDLPARQRRHLIAPDSPYASAFSNSICCTPRYHRGRFNIRHRLTDVTPRGQSHLSLHPEQARRPVDNCDNLTGSPWGDLIVCEDASGEQFLVGIQPDGNIYKFARNATPRNSEFAGATFSPVGTTLFVNVQHEGLTLAITGLWQTMGQG